MQRIEGMHSPDPRGGRELHDYAAAADPATGKAIYTALAAGYVDRAFEIANKDSRQDAEAYETAQETNRQALDDYTDEGGPQDPGGDHRGPRGRRRGRGFQDRPGR